MRTEEKTEVGGEGLRTEGYNLDKFRPPELL